MEIKEVPITRVRTGERYRYEMGDITDLAKNIAEIGILQPITVDPRYLLLAGGRRLAAAKEAGLKNIPVIVRRVRTEVDRREIELVENIFRKDLTWVERSNLEKCIFDLRRESNPKHKMSEQADEKGVTTQTVSRRILIAEAMEAIPELADCKTEDEAWKKLKRLEEQVVVRTLTERAGSKTKTAHKWAKDHYMIGDTLKQLPKIDNGVFRFAEVDPPYGVNLPEKKGRNKDIAQLDRYNEVPSNKYEDFLNNVGSEVFRVLTDNTFCVWWYGHSWYASVVRILSEVGFKVQEVPGIWYKGQAGQTSSPDTMLASCYEPFILCRKGMPKMRTPGRSNVFDFSPVSAQTKIHPTERPLELMKEILATFTYPGTSVLVPFLGSGVTLRAAYHSQLTGYGWDLDKLCKKRFISQVANDFLKVEEEEDAE